MKTMLRISALTAILAAVALAVPANAADPYKDLSIEQRAMVEQVAPTPASTTTLSGNALRLTTLLDRAEGTYRPGENVALTVETTEDAYIWVFDTGTSGRVHQLFPNEYAADNFVRAGQSLTLPDAKDDYQFLVSEPAGVELLTVIASRNNKPLTRDLIDRETSAGPFLALQGTAASLSKDLNITIKRDHPSAVAQHQVFHIVE